MKAKTQELPQVLVLYHHASKTHQMQKLPKHPYQLRHSASTAAELAGSIDNAQALLGHTSANMTKRYSHGQQVKAEALARNRRNPFDTDGLEKDQTAR